MNLKYMAAEQERSSYNIDGLKTSSPNRESGIAHASTKARALVESYLGTIIQTEVATGGLVSHVYKVTGEKQKGIVKLRGTHLAKLPQIPIDPKDVEYEWSALQFLSQIEPLTFPQPLAIDTEASLILMSNIIPDGKTLEERLETKEVTSAEIRDLGRTVARIHKKIAPFERSIRDCGDEDVYRADLQRRLGYQENPALNDVIDQLTTLPKQLILADLSPKNIGRGRTSR